jgi:hypothetical protein
MRSPFALADPVPFTVAILKAKSFTRVIFHASDIAAYCPQWRSIDRLVLNGTIRFEAACIQEGVCRHRWPAQDTLGEGFWIRFLLRRHALRCQRHGVPGAPGTSELVH